MFLEELTGYKVQYVRSMFALLRIEYWLSWSINTADNTNNDGTSNKTILLIEADSKRFFTLGKFTFVLFHKQILLRDVFKKLPLLPFASSSLGKFSIKKKKCEI